MSNRSGDESNLFKEVESLVVNVPVDQSNLIPSGIRKMSLFIYRVKKEEGFPLSNSGM